MSKGLQIDVAFVANDVIHLLNKVCYIVIHLIKEMESDRSVESRPIYSHRQ